MGDRNAKISALVAKVSLALLVEKAEDGLFQLASF